MSQPTSYTVRIHREDGEQPWAEVVELPGCFASGRDMPELRENLAEAISLYLSTATTQVTIHLEETPDSITERRVFVTC
jgi:predicted RNase H-like HicB family nuclease